MIRPAAFQIRRSVLRPRQSSAAWTDHRPRPMPPSRRRSPRSG
jgi:hypothetical protein